MRIFKKPTLFSGIQPTGNLHLGNYLGAIKQWINLQSNYNCIFCIVDYHAITIPQDPKKLSSNIINMAKIYLASGIDPEKSIIFQQSHIPEHTELAWILNSIARMGDLDKMTQFKDKSEKGKESATIGLYDYPVLMAADILLYDAEIVPVGDDQLQHVELARTLARRFNIRFGNTFKIPKAQLQKQGARIMGLDNPHKKMSKSAKSSSSYIALSDAPKVAAKKIIRAITDSGSQVKYDPKNKPAISNLLTIYSLLSSLSIESLEKKYKSYGYGHFKKDLSQVVDNFLFNFQTKLNKITNKQVKDLLSMNARKLQPQAKTTLLNIKKNIGLV